MLDIEDVLGQISKMKQIKEKEQEQAPSREDKTRAREYLRMPTDFECFVCGAKFTTNEERKQHLKCGTHGHLYDTSPQEEGKLNL
jgi:hypothetical protein